MPGGDQSRQCDVGSLSTPLFSLVEVARTRLGKDGVAAIVKNETRHTGDAQRFAVAVIP